jgi:phosphoribosylformylglycinamidine synthase subunit PurL
LGAEIEIDRRGSSAFAPDTSLASTLFGESPGRIIVSIKENNLSALQQIANHYGVPCTLLGRVGGDQFSVRMEGNELVRQPIAEMAACWQNEFEKIFAF